MAQDARQDEARLFEIDGILSQILRGLPKDLVDKLEPYVSEYFSEVKRLILDARAPRLLLVGRRGSGKSSLINALIGEPKEEVGSVRATTMENTWREVVTAHGTLRIMDSRGFGEGGTKDDVLLETLLQNIGDGTPPDVVLFLVKAKEVDARVSDDAKTLKEVMTRIEKRHGYRPILMALVTQVDELDPIDVLPPYDDEEKLANIDEAISTLKEQLQKTDLLVDTFLPISAYMRFRDGKVVADRRWNVDKLTTLLIDKIPSEAKFQLVRVTQVVSAQRKLAERLVDLFSRIAAAVAIAPIPIADMPILIALQSGMVSCIAAVSGRQINYHTFVELLGAMGINAAAGYTLREVARQLTKLFPSGSIVSPFIASAGTRAIGKAAIAYFIESQGPEKVVKLIKEAQKAIERSSSSDGETPQAASV